LQKEMSKRARDAGDARIEIEEALAAPVIAELTPAAPTKGIRALGRRALILSLGTLLLGAVIASLATWSLKPTPPKPVTRMVITLPPGDRLVGPDQPALALSPDGKQLAYAAIRGATSQLYLRSMDSQEACPYQ
jgi:hypothetical protein